MTALASETAVVRSEPVSPRPSAPSGPGPSPLLELSREGVGDPLGVTSVRPMHVSAGVKKAGVAWAHGYELLDGSTGKADLEAGTRESRLIPYLIRGLRPTAGFGGETSWEPAIPPVRLVPLIDPCDSPAGIEEYYRVSLRSLVGERALAGSSPRRRSGDLKSAANRGASDTDLGSLRSAFEVNRLVAAILHRVPPVHRRSRTLGESLRQRGSSAARE